MGSRKEIDGKEVRSEIGQVRGGEIVKKKGEERRREEWRVEERRRKRDANDIHTVIAIRELV